MNKQVREDVFRRAEGLCECGCGLPAAHLDHFWGRGKAPEDVMHCWALSVACDTKKTLNQPSRKHWLEKWAKHSAKHGYNAQVLAAFDRIAFDQAQGKSKLNKPTDS